MIAAIFPTNKQLGESSVVNGLAWPTCSLACQLVGMTPAGNALGIGHSSVAYRWSAHVSLLMGAFDFRGSESKRSLGGVDAR